MNTNKNTNTGLQRIVRISTVTPCRSVMMTGVVVGACVDKWSADSQSDGNHYINVETM